MSKQFNFRATDRDEACIITIVRLWPTTPGIDPLNKTEAIQIALAELATRLHLAEHERAGTHAGNKCSVCRALAGSATPLAD
jgi:hypothetical protein